MILGTEGRPFLYICTLKLPFAENPHLLVITEHSDADIH